MIPTQVRIFVCTERQDMRRSFDALALAVRERLELDPESGALFVFASKRGNRLKVLWFITTATASSTSDCTEQYSTFRIRRTPSDRSRRSMCALSRRSYVAS